MAKRAAQVKTEPREPASLPEVLIPPSEAPENQRSAYWLELLKDPEELKAAIASEDFFTMLQEFPDAFWDRFSIYLYRRPDDEGRMVRNAPNQKGKYLPGGVLHHAIQEEDVAKKWGGGKYTAYLKLDSKETVREHTFSIDGPPKVLDGQVLEMSGRAANPAPPAAAPEAGTTIDRVIDANSRANESSMEIVTTASKAAIGMVLEQAKNAAAPPNQLADIKTLLEIVRPPQDPVMAELMKALIAKAFSEPKTAPVIEKPETPLNETLDTIKTLTGADSIADLLKPAARAAAADPVASWGPIVSTIGSAFQSLIEKLPTILHERNETLRMELQLRGLQPSAPGQPPRLPAPAVPQPTQPSAAAHPQPTTLDPQSLVTAMVNTICAGFDKHRNTGSEIAASLDVQFGEQIEALGIDRMLASHKEIETFIDGIPALAERKKDARWPEFKEDFMGYTQERWGEPGDEADDAGEKATPSPPAA